MPGDRPWKDGHANDAMFCPLQVSVLIVRDKGLSPEAANKAAQRPSHGLDLQNGLPGSPTSGAHDLLVPPFSPLDMSWGFNPAPHFMQGNIPAPLPSPANTVDPGYFAARSMLSETLLQVYPNASQGKILEAVEAAFAVMEHNADSLW
jgi:hypothetical protein